MSPLQIVQSVIGVLLVAGIGYYIYDCESAKTFQARAVLLAEAAKDKAEKETRRLTALKEKSDADIKALRADNLSLDKRLSSERARSRAMSRTGPITASAERACFKGPLLDAAIARFLAETSEAHFRLYDDIVEVARSGTDAVSALDSAKVWAKDISP